MIFTISYIELSKYNLHLLLDVWPNRLEPLSGTVCLLYHQISLDHRAQGPVDGERLWVPKPHHDLCYELYTREMCDNFKRKK